MEKIKTILDREPLSSDYIASKQDFANVLDGAKGLGKPYWKTNWFIGTVGVTAVAIIVTAVTLSTSDSPVEEPNKPMATMAVAGDTDKEEVSEDNTADHTEQLTDATLNEDNQEDAETSTPTEVEETPTQQTPSEVIPDPAPVQAARQKPVEENPEVEEIGLPNVAGVTGGPISFKDFCDPLGIQVGNGVLIHQYTLQYRSCARDVTVRIAGNRLPRQLCEEIADCGSPIEVTFSNFKAEDRHGKAIKLQSFSLVTKPK